MGSSPLLTIYNVHIRILPLHQWKFQHSRVTVVYFLCYLQRMALLAGKYCRVPILDSDDGLLERCCITIIFVNDHCVLQLSLERL